MILWWINASFLIILLLENGRSVRINDRFILQYQKDIFGKELSQFYPIMMVNGNYQLQLPTETISFVSRYVSEGRSGFASLTCLHDCYEEYPVCKRCRLETFHSEYAVWIHGYCHGVPWLAQSKTWYVVFENFVTRLAYHSLRPQTILCYAVCLNVRSLYCLICWALHRFYHNHHRKI